MLCTRVMTWMLKLASQGSVMIIHRFVFVLAILLSLSGCQAAPEAGKLEPLTSIDQLYDVLGSDETSYVYFGRPSCPDCEDFIVILMEVISDNGITVYYFNTDYLKDEAEYEEIIDIFDVVWVPALYKVRGNVITDRFPMRFERDPNDVEVDECRQGLYAFFENR